MIEISGGAWSPGVAQRNPPETTHPGDHTHPRKEDGAFPTIPLQSPEPFAIDQPRKDRFRGSSYESWLLSANSAPCVQLETSVESLHNQSNLSLFQVIATLGLLVSSTTPASCGGL